MGKYSPFALEKALESLTLLVDTREQDTPALRERLRSCGLPTRREKLDFGDYSCAYAGPGRGGAVPGRCGGH